MSESLSPSMLQAEMAGGFAQRHGCAWFAPDVSGRRDPTTASGWWAVSGGEAQRFVSWRDLPERTVWWTNLSRAEVWTLGRWATFKEGSLFGPDWPGLMTESGHGASDEAISAAVSAWSETFARCAEWLSDWARSHTPDQPWDWGDGCLADALAPRLGWTADTPEEPQPILHAAYAESVDQEMPAALLQGRRKVVLAFPRLEHARRLWTERHPVGGWKEIKEWPRSPDERLAWVRGQERPVLARLASYAWRPGQETAGLLWLGLRGRRFPAAEFEPLWLTGEEASLLGTFAEMTLDEGFMGEGWGHTDRPPGWSMDSDDPLVGLSWSQALLSAAAWRAAASPTRDPRRRRRSWVTARAVWWRAADRLRCHRAAAHLQQKGWAVLSYGQGQVVLLVDPSDKAPDLAEAIAQAGLLMPALVARLAPLDARASHESPSHVDRWLKQIGGALPLLDIDRLVAPWAGNSPQVRAVLEPAAQRLMALGSFPSAEWGAWWKDALKQQARRSVDRLRLKGQLNR